MLKRVKTRWWALVLGAVATAGLAVSLAVLAGGEGELIVTPYSDVIRFEAPGVASLQVQIFDLSGNLLWDSGVVSGAMVDWDRRDEWGERLAYGTYLYLVQGWDSTGALKLKKTGKLALLPGDKVQLQQAPATRTSKGYDKKPASSITLTPLAEDKYYYDNGEVTIGDVGTYDVGFKFHQSHKDFTWLFRTYDAREGFSIAKLGTGGPELEITTVPGGSYTDVGLNLGGGRFFVDRFTGNVGIGTTGPAGKVDIHNNANQPALRIEASAGTNLIEAYNTGSGSATGLIFRVERETGNVRADGAFYGAGFYSGSADVAEHINVSEPVEPGDVVEIDPNKPGYFRKARGAYSRLVAGVISSDPGVVLGSNSDPVEGQGDSRPVLALAGRVPVKATTENGPIRVGDLLVASSKPGYAMRCSDPASAVGAVIGKALEPLEEGEGIIMVQVTLR